MDIFTIWWQKHLQDYDALLFDIDGTLMVGSRVLPGADDFLTALRQNNFPFYLLTNDGNHSVDEKSSIAAKSGLRVAPGEIISCGMAIRHYVEHHQLDGQQFFVMGDLGKPCYAENAGLIVCRDVKQIEACSGVIVGEGFYDWQANISAVFNFFVKHPERHMIVPNPDSYWPAKKGEFGIGAGSKARFVCNLLNEMGIVVTPAYLGKPYSIIYDYAVELLQKKYQRCHFEYKRILMLGDSLKADIAGAKNVGMTSGLMLTGITTAAQARNAVPEQRPEYIFVSLA
jgi:HAD superfamily hydrolase (TIGR01450 family)